MVFVWGAADAATVGPEPRAEAVVGGAEVFLVFLRGSGAWVEEVGVLFFRLMADATPDAQGPFVDARASAAPATGTVLPELCCEDKYIENSRELTGPLLFAA